MPGLLVILAAFAVLGTMPVAILALERDMALRADGIALALALLPVAFVVGLGCGLLLRRPSSFRLRARIFLLGGSAASVLTGLGTSGLSLSATLAVLGLMAALPLWPPAGGPPAGAHHAGQWPPGGAALVAGVGVAAGALLTSVLLVAQGWRVTFIALGVAMLCLAALPVGGRPPKPEPRRSTSAGVAAERAEERPILLVLVVMAAASTLVTVALTACLPLILRERPAELVPGIMLAGAATALALALGGLAQAAMVRLLARSGARRVLLSLGLVKVASLGVLLMAPSAAIRIPAACLLIAGLLADATAAGWILRRQLTAGERRRATDFVALAVIVGALAVPPLLAGTWEAGHSSAPLLLVLAAVAALQWLCTFTLPAPPRPGPLLSTHARSG